MKTRGTQAPIRKKNRGRPEKYPVRVVSMSAPRADGSRRMELEVVTLADGFRTRWSVDVTPMGAIIWSRNADQDAISRHRMALLMYGGKRCAEAVRQQPLFRDEAQGASDT